MATVDCIGSQRGNKHRIREEEKNAASNHRTHALFRTNTLVRSNMRQESGIIGESRTFSPPNVKRLKASSFFFKSAVFTKPSVA